MPKGDGNHVRAGFAFAEILARGWGKLVAMEISGVFKEALDRVVVFWIRTGSSSYEGRRVR